MAPKTINIPSLASVMDGKTPDYDGTPIKKGLWFVALEKYLPELELNYKLLITKGVVRDRYGVAVASRAHAFLFKARRARSDRSRS